MHAPTLSVVMPVYNEAPHLADTMDALVHAEGRSEFTTEVVLVDDGSTDGSAAVAVGALRDRIPSRVVTTQNRGRFAARQAGLELARSALVLLLDARVRIDPEALHFLYERHRVGEDVWTAHVHVVGRSRFGTFWSLLAELAWRRYFDEPRTTSFGVEDFDEYPKGTTCFAAPRELLIDAFGHFRSAYADVRNANDDTPLLRWVAGRQRIHVSPNFACAYTPRDTVRSFVGHSVHRGVVFVDGHGRRESRFFPFAIAFFPASGLFALVAIRRPALVPLGLASCGVIAAAYGVRAGRSPREVRTLALVTPLYAVAHAFGMWKGLALIARDRHVRPRLSAGSAARTA